MSRERVAIIGSRKWPSERLHEVADYVAFLPAGSIVVSGGAIGVDTAAEEAALLLGMEVDIQKLNYDLFGPRAPLIRNLIILGRCDRVVAFWDGVSNGTMYTVKEAAKRKIPTEVLR